MSFRLQASCLVIALSACTITSAVTPAWCNELVTEEKASINKWIQELDSDLFSKRNAASRELERLGSRAFPALEEAAMNSESREVTSRSVDILKGWFGREDSPEHKTAEESLQRISEGEHGPAARLAQNVLSPPVIESRPQNRFGGRVIINGNAQIKLGGGAIQIQRQAFPIIPGGNVKRMSTKIANGRKEIEVEEGEQKLKIVEEKEGKITVEITKKVNGKEKTEKYEAKNAAELKKNHPDASKEYEKYAGKAKGNNIAQIQIQNIVPQILPNAPRQVPGPRILPAPGRPVVLPQNIRDRLKKHQKTIEKRIADLDPNNEADKRSIEGLKRQIEGLQKIIDR